MMSTGELRSRLSLLAGSKGQALWDLMDALIDDYAERTVRADAGWVELFRFSVPGDPRGKGRPRFSRAAGRAYTDSATRHYEDRVACAAREAWGGPPIDRNTPVRVTLVATFKRPGNRYRVKDEGQDQKTTKPDLDNVTKATLDALDLAGIIADQQVIEVHSRKQLAPIVDRKAKTCGPTGLLVVVEVAT